MTMPAATSRLTVPLALTIALFTVACQPETDRDAPAPTAPATTEPAPTPAPADATETFHWQCGEVGVASTYIDDAQSVTLAFSGRELELPIAVSASGARYADTAGNEFWTKGDSGTLTLAAEAGSETAKRECSRTDRSSPWFQATERGIGFRAVGNEPGWFVEVDRGETPALRATLDYGERKIELARSKPLDGDSPGFSGNTADGTEVLLTIEHEPCRDDMSGAPFEASARLKVGDMTYQGCGAFLNE